MIKNFNSNWFKDKNKNVKKFTISIMTITTISLTGCLGGLDDNKKSKDYDSKNEKIYSIFDDSSIKEYNEYNIKDSNDDSIVNNTNKDNSNQNKINVDNSVYNIEVSFSNIDTEESKNKIKNINVDYYFSDIFNAFLALNKYNSMKEYDSKHSLKYIDSNNKILRNELKSKIESNTKSYLNTTIRTNYDNLSLNDFNRCFDYLVEQLEKNIDSSIDIYQLDDNLDNLKFVSGKMDANGLYDDVEGVLALNLKVIANNSNPDFFQMIVKHETNHIMQAASSKEMKQEGYSKNMGLVYKWDDLKFNTLNFQWFAEAGAENLMRLDVNSSYDTSTYQYIVDSMDIMTYVGLYKEGFNVYTLPKLSMQSNLNKLFDLYDCKTDSEKIEMINMLYSFEIIDNDRNTDFNNAYKVIYNQNFDDYQAIDIINTKCCETLSKYFYYNLISGLEKNNESLENIFAYISIYESYLNSFTKIRNRQDGYRESFINIYEQSQDTFFDLLSKSTNVSTSDLYELYDNYCAKNKEVSFNSNILNSESIKFINNKSSEKKANKLTTSLKKLIESTKKKLH